MNAIDENVLVAVPCFGGLVGWRCADTLIQIDRRFTEAGIQHAIQFIPGGSLIPQIRNYIANVGLFGGTEGKLFSSVFMIDADISFDGEAAVEMVRANKSVTVLPYAFKTIDWGVVADCAKAGVPSELLAQAGTIPVITKDDKPFRFSEPTPVMAAGTGAILIQRQVLQALADAHPEWSYRTHPSDVDQRILATLRCVPGSEGIAFNFFQLRVNPETCGYESEDYFFIQEARKIGFEVFMLPSVKTIHTGPFEYETNLKLQQEIGRSVRVRMGDPAPTGRKAA
jgi:hypothetical protein